MLPFGVTIPAALPQGSEIPQGRMNNPVLGDKQYLKQYKNTTHKKGRKT
jgi:hypothetical protein